MRPLLIVNPVASRVTPSLLREVEAELGDVETVLTERRGHATELAREASGANRRLYVLAGDGVYNETLNGLDGDVPVGLVPGGWTSVLPRALGLPRDAVTAARLLARGSHSRRISLGRANGRRFGFSAGLGLDAQAVRYVDERGRAFGRRPGDATFVWAFARLLARGRIAPALEVEGYGRAAWVLVANGDPYTYLGRVPLHVAPEARFELGLDLVAPRSITAGSVPRFARYAVRGRGQESARDVLYAHDLQRIVVRCGRPTALQVDGEDLGDVTEVEFVEERDAAHLLVG